MKTIDLVTFHSAVNHGTVLQAYALKKTMEDMGCSVRTVDYRPSFMRSDYLGPGQSVRTLGKRLLQYLIFRLFVKKHLNLTERVYRTLLDLVRHPLRADHVVCGSDQVWNLEITKGLDPVYFLDFPSNSTKKIAYAVSMGETVVPDGSAAGFKDAVSKIPAISVRERFTRDQLILSGRGGPIPVVLDPTLLPVDFAQILPKKDPGEPYIALYYISKDDEVEKAAMKLKRILNIPIVNISSSRFTGADKNELFLNPAEWLQRVRHAAVVCTNSFHGTALAVKFNRPFYSIKVRGKSAWAGNRISELLSSLDLSPRLVDTSDDLPENREALLEMAGSQRTVELLEARQAYSLNFLREALSKVPSS
jgi:hypothetical protein